MSAYRHGDDSKVVPADSSRIESNFSSGVNAGRDLNPGEMKYPVPLPSICDVSRRSGRYTAVPCSKLDVDLRIFDIIC
jgi:hypothetical protein